MQPVSTPQVSTPLITRRLRVGLGTFIAIETDSVGPGVAEAGIRAAFDAVGQVDRLMHPTRAGSDLVRIRDGVAGVPVAVHAWTWELLALCQRLNRLSCGSFDPCLPESPARLDGLDLVAPSQVVADGRLHLDLGGIAKGFAVDRAIDALRAAGCDGGLVNAGGDLAVFGDRAHEIVIRNSSGVVSVALCNAALATSDRHSLSRPREHRGYYQGATGRAQPAPSAAVTAASAAVADGLTTCLVVDAGQDASLFEAFSAQRVT